MGLAAYYKAAGGQTDPDLASWLAELPLRIQQKLVAIGLVNSERAAASKPLAQHADDFERALTAKGTTAKQAGLAKGSAKRIIDSCGCRYHSDISGGKDLSYLADLRNGEQTISKWTRNF